MFNKTALIIGATGLVGRHLLTYLLEGSEYKSVVALTRKKLEVDHEKLEQHLVDFDRLSDYHELFSVDTVFCTLGTTMKVAKTKEQFVKVDFDYPFEAARLAKQSHVPQFFLVTAMGANQHSRFFYNQVKGNAEEAIKQLDFRNLYIIRPSLLVGERESKRLGEDFGQKLYHLFPNIFRGRLQKYKPNQGLDVAKVMYHLSLVAEEGTHIIESSAIENYKERPVSQ